MISRSIPTISTCDQVKLLWCSLRNTINFSLISRANLEPICTVCSRITRWICTSLSSSTYGLSGSSSGVGFYNCYNLNFFSRGVLVTISRGLLLSFYLSYSPLSRESNGIMKGQTDYSKFMNSWSTYNNIVSGRAVEFQELYLNIDSFILNWENDLPHYTFCFFTKSH